MFIRGPSTYQQAHQIQVCVYQKNATMDMLDIIDVIIMEIVPIQVSITKKQMDTMIVNAINSMMDQRAQINNNTMKQQRLQQYNQQQEKH